MLQTEGFILNGGGCDYPSKPVTNKDPGKDEYVVVSSFYWREVFKPSFIGRLQTSISRIFGVGRRKKLYDNTKFKLIMVPAGEQSTVKSPARTIAEYYENALSQEELADMVERMKAIPPGQMKEMFKEWWAVSARQYLADNGLEELSDEENGTVTELSPEKFHELIENARKLTPVDPIFMNRGYPALVDAEKFSVNDFAEAAKILNEQKLYTDVISQFVDEKTKEVDKIVFDCFQQYLGCKKADDVFAILTSPVMFHNYNGILQCINTRLAREVGPLGSPSGMQCIKLGEMTEPATGSPEMLETLRTRWKEIYDNQSSANGG